MRPGLDRFFEVSQSLEQVFHFAVLGIPHHDTAGLVCFVDQYSGPSQLSGYIDLTYQICFITALHAQLCDVC